MDAFKLHRQVIDNYRNYLQSFTSVRDSRIKKYVDKAFRERGFIPEPLIQFNPSYERSEKLDDMVAEGKVHPSLKKVFGDFNLYRHQAEAIRHGVNDRGFIVTSGTGSGKSLTYMATVFNTLLKLREKSKGVKAVIVYPMNALINSQEEEIRKLEGNYAREGGEFPVSFAKYTGQESSEKREEIKRECPDVILTNYMMLELIMTRHREEWMRDSMRDHLKYLVFDELHTYRGRQGADVSMLIRRIKNEAKNEVVCIGTSATMATGESPIERKKAVAEVGEKIFGVDFAPEQVVEETLVNCTAKKDSLPGKDELRSSVEKGVDISQDEKVFKTHPLAVWLENRVALRRNNGLIERGEPLTFPQISGLLEEDSGAESQRCQEVIHQLLKWAERLSVEAKARGEDQGYLPYKIYQFISQTSTVFVTLEPRGEREITIEDGLYPQKEEKKEKYIYPVLFSRYSGHDFICVTKDFETKKLKPRNPEDLEGVLTKTETRGMELTEENFPVGYLIIQDKDEEDIWSEENIENLPESWKQNGAANNRLQPYYRFQVPVRIYFDSDGNFSDKPGYDQMGWFIPARLRVDPTAGIVYEDVQTNENTKLMRLGNEGRSTATTTLSYSIIRSLHEQGEDPKNQKLLSFTDNRQDASLQSGHFNDFIAAVKLRSALYHALEENGEELKVYNIAGKVFSRLSLKESEYAREPNDDWPDEENSRAVEDLLLLRLFHDLKRGWRYILPNLEQCGLLRIEYEKLEEFCKRDEFFSGLQLFTDLSPEERYNIAYQILDFFRTSYSLYHPMLVDHRGDKENFIKTKLDETKSWSLDKNEKIEIPSYLVPANPGRTQRSVYTASIGPRSALGKYLKRLFREKGMESLPEDELREYIVNVCDTLKKGNFLKKRDEIAGDRGVVCGYMLRADKILWKAGDEKSVPLDRVRISSYDKLEIKPNEYFSELYKYDFSTYSKPLKAREHTGQLGNVQRIERESQFREGDISALYCSPTMELGIDIAELNIVHMRNVPPNPANYAQRSGRAGRSGQAAIVFTYCSSRSPHDRNYFKSSSDMVAGKVVPPKIDLKNEELILSHFNAFILMRLGLSSLHVAISDIVDISNPHELPLKTKVKDFIEDQHNHYSSEWVKEFRQAVSGIVDQLDDTHWFGENWMKSRADTFLTRFDKAFNRWRTLYSYAHRMQENANLIIKDPTVKFSSEESKEARRQRGVAERQIALLRNESRSSFGNESEFYVFRYLASEGFLPGYNFTRLPVRAFVGYRHQDQGEYISRPRFVALKEFGPQNLIYHDGNKYRMHRMMLLDAEAKTRPIKISKQTGYAFLDEEAELANNDPITNTELKGEDNVDKINTLLELNESEGYPQQRISCGEEERMSQGFEIDQYFRYIGGIQNTRQAVVKSGGKKLLNLIYDQATELIQLNRRWRRSKDMAGFYIDTRNGRWLRQVDLENAETKEHARQVMLMARDNSDTLYIQPVKDLEVNPDQVISLSYALRRGIERLFQVEESEVGVWVMGNPEAPNIMIYEASEGSLGILSQLIETPGSMRDLFIEAYRVLHFNPSTREDERPDLPKASYEDLLSYYNQPHHEILDRFAVKKVLETLMDCNVEIVRGKRDRQEHYRFLLESYDKSSSTELAFLKYLYEKGHALPDKAQVNIPGYYINADFVYDLPEAQVLVFCDGAVHDDNRLWEEDLHKRKKLRDSGYDVIEWSYKEPLEDLVEKRKDVFRKIN